MGETNGPLESKASHEFSQKFAGVWQSVTAVFMHMVLRHLKSSRLAWVGWRVSCRGTDWDFWPAMDRKDNLLLYLPGF
jgi:hypothetical protein